MTPYAFATGPGVGPDPYSGLRMMNANSMMPAMAQAGTAGQADLAKAWQEQGLKARQLVLQQQAVSAQMVASRTQREIHIGNLAPNITTQDTLKQVFGSALAVRFPTLCSPEMGPVVVKVNLHSSQKFAFMELRTSEFATAALDLNNQILLPGAPGPMTVNRPSGYIDPARALVAAAAAAQTLSQFQSSDGPGGVSDTLAPSTAVAQSVASALHLGSLPGPPLPSIAPSPQLYEAGAGSSFIKVSGMITEGLPKEEIDEIKEDLESECKNHGRVVGVSVVGHYLMVRFDGSLAASAALTTLNGRMFDGRQLSVCLISEAELQSNHAL